MAWVKMIEPEEATGELRAEYNKAKHLGKCKHRIPWLILLEEAGKTLSRQQHDILVLISGARLC
jgi:hypothetical protein